LKRALLLLAHGSRDPQWRKPLERLLEAVSSRSRFDAVALAYLESTAPDLESTVGELFDGGIRRQTIVPVFLGSGRHLKRDLVRKVAALHKRHAGLRLTVRPPIGEQRAVIEAIAIAIAARKSG
jgi:sirohydrochlorin cobaltochelatase